ncbi:MAG TPA: ergothioneine biosynthesis protein EgtB [Chroococcidiopsis sp.]
MVSPLSSSTSSPIVPGTAIPGNAAPENAISENAISENAVAQSPHRSLATAYGQVRQLSEQICQPLMVEDYGVQTMPDVSPPKWHLAHTTWFFETFLLIPHLPNYQVFHSQFGYLFNSYYEAVGQRHPRPQRGLLSRPTVAEVYRYRAYVDQAMRSLLQHTAGDPAIATLITLGLHHEQQHQELLFTDLKHILATNPLRPAYRPELVELWQGGSSTAPALSATPAAETWLDYPGGLYAIGYETPTGNGSSDTSTLDTFALDTFAFDNESPRHSVYLQDFWLGARLVTNGEYLEFINAGGYRQPEHWLSEGWATVQREQWEAPLYWEAIDGQWWVMTLGGMLPVAEHEPVCHVSFFEADAFARWAGKRLPTEGEWEVAAAAVPCQGNLLASGRLHPAPAQGMTRPDQLYGDVWEWTQSPYSPYPGFKTAAGAIGEYNGKFMCNQMVLRGGSCVTPPGHIRPTYRNFFPPSTRWQFSGIRLAM